MTVTDLPARGTGPRVPASSPAPVPSIVIRSFALGLVVAAAGLAPPPGTSGGQRVAQAAVIRVGAVARVRATAATQRHSLTVSSVVAALHHAGLSIDTPRRQPVEGDPSGPPLTEREAWGLTLHGVTNGEMRLLLFDTLARRDTLAAWYHSVGARIVVHLNAILWLDPHLSPRLATRCRIALDGTR